MLVDRLGRNLAHLVNTVQDLSVRSVGLRVFATARTWWPGHRLTDSVRVCSPASRRVAPLRPRFAGLTALTPAPRTLVQTGSCRRCPILTPYMLWLPNCAESGAFQCPLTAGACRPGRAGRHHDRGRPPRVRHLRGAGRVRAGADAPCAAHSELPVGEGMISSESRWLDVRQA